MFDLNAVQTAIANLGLDGWLLYDFRGSNMLARRVADIGDDAHLSRRWFYYIPAKGEPKKLVHKIEPGTLDHLPGSSQLYLRWQELEWGVTSMLVGSRRVAMEYVARNANPYISKVDAGTIELVRSCGVDIVPSGDLIQLFEACWSPEQWQSHLEASVLTRKAFDVAFDFIGDEVRARGQVMETAVQARILKFFAYNGLVTDAGPIVGRGPHSADPHFSPSADHDFPIRKGDFVLVDLWAKMDRPMAVYSDLTRTAFVGDEVPAEYTKVFNVVAAARDAGIACVREAFAAGRAIQGWEVDRATRDVIERARYGEFFFHRTGHSIGQETHGNGANMDNLETREERRILPRTCFSIEPGIYRADFGVRSEVDVYVDENGGVHVTGGDPQTEIHKIPV